jgi:SAM-dependent methyltransferase
MSEAESDRQLLDEQIAYYRRRAPEYDATSRPEDDPFEADADRIRGEVRAFAPRGRVLELAAGTGQWTALLAEFADELTAVDASPEALALNRAKVAAERVRYVAADLFALDPEPIYDVVFFAFWLSHVPPGRFGEFWDRVAGWLAPGGRTFFVDERRHQLWEEERHDQDPTVVRRRLRDGTTHRLVKVLWSASELEGELRGRGWEVTVREAGPFYWGAGTPPEGDRTNR